MLIFNEFYLCVYIVVLFKIYFFIKKKNFDVFFREFRDMC